jgi:hypothetical protein
MSTRRLFLAKLAGLAGFTLLSKAKGDYTKPLSLPVVLPRVQDYKGDSGVQVNRIPKEDRQKIKDALVESIDYDRLLYCISAVETGHDDTVVGPCGARSRYQISEAVWLQHIRAVRTSFGLSPRSFRRHCRWRLAEHLGLSHLAWLAQRLGQQASVYTLAWCWKEGLEAYLRKGAPSDSYIRGWRYADSVTNLYNDSTYRHT